MAATVFIVIRPHPLDAANARDEALPFLSEHVLQCVPELVEQRLHLPAAGAVTV